MQYIFAPCVSEAIRTQHEMSSAPIKSNLNTVHMSKVTSFIPDAMKETAETVMRQAVLHKSLRDLNLDLLDKAQFDKDVNTKDKRQPRNIYAAIVEEKTI